MNATEAQAGNHPAYQAAPTTKALSGSAIMESLGALATIALAIVGLTGTLSAEMAAIATIVLGAAVWIEGNGFPAGYVTRVSREGSDVWGFEASETLGAEFLGGLSAVVLGVLALLGINSSTLVPIAALVLGATFLFSSRAGIYSSSRAMSGLAGLVLGLLAVCGVGAITTLVLVALVCLGASALFSGSAGARAAFRRVNGSQPVANS